MPRTINGFIRLKAPNFPYQETFPAPQVLLSETSAALSSMILIRRATRMKILLWNASIRNGILTQVAVSSTGPWSLSIKKHVCPHFWLPCKALPYMRSHMLPSWVMTMTMNVSCSQIKASISASTVMVLDGDGLLYYLGMKVISILWLSSFPIRKKLSLDKYY